MKTIIELHDENYNIAFYHTGRETPSMTGSGPYHNFNETVNNLDEWFACHEDRDTEVVVEDFRTDKSFDPITFAKAQEKAKWEAIDKALEIPFAYPHDLHKELTKLGATKFTIWKELRTRWGFTINDCREFHEEQLQEVI